jgi:hypothetical protein
MVKEENRIYVEVAKLMAMMVVSVVLARFSAGFFLVGIIFAGMWCAFTEKFGWAIACYLFLTFCVSINPILLPPNGIQWSIIYRFGPLMIALILIISAARRSGNHRIPFGGIIPFLVIACISSVNGFFPSISYMKLISYFLFISGLWLGTQNLQNRPNDMFIVRATLLAMIALVVYLGLAFIPFPAVSYSTSLRGALAYGGVEYANEIAKEITGDSSYASSLFCGILNHSQALSPVAGLSFAFVACDMLFIEKRFRLPHLITLALLVPIMFMTRSRLAFMILAASLVIINFFTVRKINVTRRVKQAMSNGMLAFTALVMIFAVVMEVKDHSISRWLRKTDDLGGDTRDLGEALTQSREGVMERSMWEFRRSPIFGSGFQVMLEHQYMFKKGEMVFSAPIEKGVLPVMVLGETGVVGSIFFAFFVLSFLVTCMSRKLYVTLTMFLLLIVSNMGEATFFSPGGIGGVLYILSIVGGFALDSVLKAEKFKQQQVYFDVEANDPYLQDAWVNGPRRLI